MKEFLKTASIESSRQDMDKLSAMAAFARELHDNATAALKTLKMEGSCHRTVAQELTDELGATRAIAKQLTVAWGMLDLLSRPALMRQNKNGRKTRQAVRTLHEKVLMIDEMANPYIDTDTEQRITDVVNLDEKTMDDGEEDPDLATPTPAKKRRSSAKAVPKAPRKKKKAESDAPGDAAQHPDPRSKKAKTATPVATDEATPVAADDALSQDYVVPEEVVPTEEVVPAHKEEQDID